MPTGIDLGGELLEEGRRHRLRCRVDHAAAQLRQLAADLRLDLIGQDRLIAVLAQAHDGAAARITGAASLALAGDAVAVRRVNVRQGYRAGELCGNRSHLQDRECGHLRVGPLDELLATGNAGAQHVRIVEGSPDLVARRGDALLARHVHRIISLIAGSRAVHSCEARRGCNP